MRIVIQFIAALSLCLGLGAAASAAEHGTREEAVAMTDAAYELIMSEGVEAAAAVFNDAGDVRFHDRDLYVYVVGADGKYVAHGAKPTLKGIDATKLSDPNGVMIVEEMVKATADGGTGWVDYQWPSPVSGQVQKKSGYARGLPDGGFVGVGVYLED